MNAYRSWQLRNPLRVWRHTTGVTQIEIALDLDVSGQAVVNWEGGSMDPTRHWTALAVKMGVGDRELKKKWLRWRRQCPRA